MSETPPDPTVLSSLSGPTPARVAARPADWGGKALIVCFLAVLMAIPGLFVFALVNDRTSRAAHVVQEVADLQGGSQQLTGPLLVVPYTLPATRDDEGPRGGLYVISPETGGADIDVTTQVRHRGLFQVPVFQASARVTAHFGPLPEQLNLPPEATPDWSAAQIVMGFSDLRGARADIAGQLTGPSPTPLTFVPSAMSLGNPAAGPSGRSSTERGFGLVSTSAAALVRNRQGGDISATVSFTGAQRLSVLPFAKATRVRIHGDWNSPSFDGGFLPRTRSVTPGGFTAEWLTPFIARGLADHGPAETLSLAPMSERDVGVTLMRASDAYQSVTRALKYGVMFVGLVFLTFFVFEALSGRRLHPAQYVLIGLAQMIFYLLLLSLSEWIGFDGGFGVSAAATVGLIGLYAGWAFRSRRYQIQALVIFTAVYGLIYLLMRLEDLAMLAGSLASFLGLSTAMWLTRNLDWYGGRENPPARITPAG